MWMAQIGSDLLTDGTVIIPVAVHWQRFLHREYNQA
jgi:predicted amidophosphoribosyltransferase